MSAIVLFLCPYGGAKSVIAASHFNRIARSSGLPYAAVAAAAEEPYEGVPEPVAELLASGGEDVHAFKPRHVEAVDLATAERVVAIDCDLSQLDLSGVSVERWDDVPKVFDDLYGSAAAIQRHVESLAEELRARR
jgi:protein-tyrosine-phosphatase